MGKSKKPTEVSRIPPSIVYELVKRPAALTVGIAAFSK